MQRRWNFDLTISRISAHEPAGLGVVVSGAQIVQPEIRVVLLAAIQVVVGCGARVADLIAEGIVVEGVGYSEVFFSQHGPRGVARVYMDLNSFILV